MSLVKTCIVTKKCVTNVDENFKKKKFKKPSKPLLQRIKELGRRIVTLRLFVLRRIATLRLRVNRLVRAVNQLNNRITSLQTLVNDLTLSTEATRSFLESRIGTTVTIETIAGPVSGKLVIIGGNFVQLVESTGDTVLIPLASINAVS